MIGAALVLLSAAPQAPALADIEMHLWYETTGRLSRDLTQQPGFVGWNAIIGEGSADEPANDLLVVIRVTSAGEANVEGPLTVTVNNATGKLAARDFRDFDIAKDGRVALPLWVPNVGCAGDIVVTARMGSQRRSEALVLNCGE